MKLSDLCQVSPEAFAHSGSADEVLGVASVCSVSSMANMIALSVDRVEREREYSVWIEGRDRLVWERPS